MAKHIPMCRRHNPVSKAISTKAFRNRVVEPKNKYDRQTEKSNLRNSLNNDSQGDDK